MSWNFACVHILLRRNFCICKLFPKRARQKFLCSKSGILKRAGFLIYDQNIYWASKGGFTGSLCLYLFFSLNRSIEALWANNASVRNKLVHSTSYSWSQVHYFLLDGGITTHYPTRRAELLPVTGYMKVHTTRKFWPRKQLVIWFTIHIT